VNAAMISEASNSYLRFVSLQASRCSEQGATPNQSAEALKSKARKREVPAPMPALAWGLWSKNEQDIVGYLVGGGYMAVWLLGLGRFGTSGKT